MDYLKFLITPDYYFNIRPSIGYFGFLIPLGILFGAMLIMALYFHLIYGPRHKGKPFDQIWAKKLSGYLYNVSIIGLLYLFMRYEGVLFLSNRLILIGLMIYAIISGYYLYLFKRDEYPVMRTQFVSRIKKNQYRPKKRKK